MRRPAVRLLLTLALSACAVGFVPATTEAGIIPWAYDAVFGPVGSLQGRQVSYYGGGIGGGCTTGCGYGAYYQGPTVGLFGRVRARRVGLVAYGGYGGGFDGYSANYGYANYGGIGMGGCSTGCGYPMSGCSSCGGYGSSCSSYGGCSTGGCGTGGCGVGGCGYDGYGVSSYGGGCASGQCNANYGPITGSTNSGSNSAAAPVTPARPPVTSDANTTPKTNGPTQYEPQPMGRSGTNDGYGTNPGEGFRPRNSVEAAPTGGDPNVDQFVPPRVNTTNKAEGEAPAGANPDAQAPADTGTPPVVPVPKAPKRNFGDEDDKKESNVGPRLELQEKITWRHDDLRNRQMLSAVRVSATVNRAALFPKMAWKSTGGEAELAKK